MNCKNCNATLPQDAVTCPACGTPVEQTSTPQTVETTTHTPTDTNTTGENPQTFEAESGWATPPLAPPADAVAAIPPKKKGKGIFIAIACVLVVAILAVLLGPIIYYSLFPTNFVFKAYQNTFSTIGQEFEATAKTLGISNVQDLLNGKQASKQSYAASFSNGGSVFSINVGSSGTILTDMKKEQLQADLSLTIQQIPLVNMQVAARGNEMAVKANGILPKQYGINTENFATEFNASPFSEYSGLTVPEGFGFNLFKIADTSKNIDTIVSKSSKKELEQLTIDFVKSFETKKQPKSDITVNGIQTSATEYVTTISPENMDVLFAQLNDILIADETFIQFYGAKAGDSNTTSLGAQIKTNIENLKIALADAGYLDNKYIDTANSTLTADEAKQEISAIIDALKQAFSNEITISSFITNKKVVKSTINFKLATKGDTPVPISITTEFGNGKNMIDAFSMEVQAVGESLKLAIGGTHVPVNGIFESNLSISDSTQETPLLVSKLVWKSADSENNFTFNATFDSVEAVAKGNMNVDAQAKSLSLDLNDIKLGDRTDNVDLTLKYDIEPLGDAKFDDFKPVPLSELDAETLDQVLNSISSLLRG